MFQLTLTSVRVSWAGLLERADCADSMLVKHYKGDNTNDFSMSDPLSVTTNSYIVRDVVPLQSYTYQVTGALINEVDKAFWDNIFILFSLICCLICNVPQPTTCCSCA